jgi:dynein heavy chain
MSLAAELELGDARVEFVCDYVLKTMKIKADKWTKMYSVEENKQMILEFFEKNDRACLLISANAAGVLSVSFGWPSQIKSKAVYFVRKGQDHISKDANLRNLLIYGDLSYAPIEQLSVFVDEVSTFQMHLPSLMYLYICTMTSYISSGAVPIAG